MSLRSAQRPLGCRFTTVLSFLAWLSEGPCAGARGWCQGEPTVESAGVASLLRCCTWQAGDCCWVTCSEEEKSHMCSSPATSGADEPSEGKSVRIAATPAHVREAGWGACGFKDVSEERMACSALPLPLLCFSSKQKLLERLPGYQPWQERLYNCFLVPHPQVSEDSLAKKFLCSSQGSMGIPRAPGATAGEGPTGPSFRWLQLIGSA